MKYSKTWIIQSAQLYLLMWFFGFTKTSLWSFFYLKLTMKSYLILWLEAPAVASTVSYDEKNNLSKGTEIFGLLQGYFWKITYYYFEPYKISLNLYWC